MNKNVKILLLIIVLVAIVAVLLFVSFKNDNAESNKDIIAVSIVPEVEFIKAISGEDFEIITMIPPRASPENYEPTPLEKQKFEKAKVYFSMGVPTEENNILPNISANTRVVKLDEVVRIVYEDLTFENGSRDSHIWLSPKRVVVMVEEMAEVLGELKPENKELYKENADKYIEQLQNVSTEIKNIVAGKENKKFVVYHPAFAYLADELGMEMYALEEEGKEATAQSLKEKIDLAKKEGIKYIFYQAEIDSSQSEAYAEEIGGQTMKLEPLAQDYINNLKEMATLLAK